MAYLVKFKTGNGPKIIRPTADRANPPTIKGKLSFCQEIQTYNKIQREAHTSYADKNKR